MLDEMVDEVAETVDRLVTESDGAMVLVTASSTSERAGCLVAFHSQSSVDPPHYAVWLARANRTFTVALESECLGVHFLTSADHRIAQSFGSKSGDSADRFRGLECATGPGGLPVISELPNHLIGRRIATLDDGGDHICFVIEPIAAKAQPMPWQPLRLSDVDDVAPGAR